MINKEEEVKNEIQEEVLDSSLEGETILEEDIIADLTVEAQVSEDELMEEVNNEVKDTPKGGSFFKSLLAAIVDQVICVGSSIILLYIISMVMPLFGYRLVDKLTMLLIVYLVFSTLYTPILESTRLNNTLGKALLRR